MSGEFDDDEIADDFYSLVADAQLNELKAVDAQRAYEREEIALLNEHRKEQAMTLMQIAGMKSQKELDRIAAEKHSEEVEQTKNEDRKRKAAENAKLTDQFPPPIISHS